MNLRGFRSLTVTLLLLGAGLLIIAVAAAKIPVAPERALSVAILDTQRTTPEQVRFQSRITATLRAAISESCGGELQIRTVVIKARDAKLKPAGGGFDAALVFGSNCPATLRRIDFLTLTGSLPATSGPALQPISLVIPKGDPVLNECLRQAFSRLQAESRIYEMERPRIPFPKLSGDGAKVAALTD